MRLEPCERRGDSAVAICNLIIDFFDGEVQEMKAAKE